MLPHESMISGATKLYQQGRNELSSRRNETKQETFNELRKTSRQMPAEEDECDPVQDLANVFSLH